MKKIKLSWFLLPILTSPILANFISCSNQKEESVTFNGSDFVDAQRTNSNELFVQYTDFSFFNLKHEASQTLEVTAIATFCDNIEAQIIYTQNNNFDVRIYIPNASNYEHGEYILSLIIYNRDESKSYFNQVLRFNVNPSIVVPKETPILSFERVDDYYWAKCSGFTLKNFQSPYNYGFKITGSSSELGNIKLEFEIEETNLSGDVSFSIFFKSDAELIDPSSSYYILLKVPNLQEETITFEVNGKKVGFEKDSWDTVFLHANEGFDSLKRYYGLDTFVGLTRQLKINGLTYNVKVIGENCDEISGAEGTYAPLTFQFCELISDSAGQALQFRWSKYIRSLQSLQPFFNFWHHYIVATWGDMDAEIRLYLNQEDGFLSLLPPGFKNHLRTIKKKTSFIDKDSWTLIEDTSDDLIWLPSVSEICPSFELSENGPFGCIREGECYEYYRNESSKGAKSEKRAKTSKNGWTMSYWTRTPEIYSKDSKNHDMVYKVNGDGSLTDVYIENETIGIVPCFAI